jgi:hypothetical protein
MKSNLDFTKYKLDFILYSSLLMVLSPSEEGYVP